LLWLSNFSISIRSAKVRRAYVFIIIQAKIFDLALR
jgi:hypothetical protein